MGKNQVRNVIVHVPVDADLDALRARVSRFHVAVIERRLGGVNMPMIQKNFMLELIMLKMKKKAI